MNKYMNADKLKEAIEIKLGFTHAIFNIIDELSEEREDVSEFINNCNISKEDWLVYLERGTHNDIIENMIKSYVDISNRFKQPNPLKVAIKGDCTYDYSKKIFQYFKSHTIKGQHDVDSFLEDVYYYIEKGNIVFSPFLPEDYTEISLKEEGKINQVEAFPEITNLEKRVEAIEQKLKKLSE